METQARSRVAREEWAKRVERWQDSGLTCAEFAAELGVNSRTLTYWKWLLSKEARGERRSWPSGKSRKPGTRAGRARRAAPGTPLFVSGLVEVVQPAAVDGRFELELGAGRRLRVPASFDAAELRRLLQILEAP